MRGVAVIIAALLAVPLAACSMTTSTICVDFIGPLSADEAGTEAAIVVVGHVTGLVGHRGMYGEQAPVHSVEVEAVLKGDLPAQNTIEVAAVPQTCNGDAGPFPDGDPLQVDGRVELFLFEEGGDYHLLTPWDGVIAAPEGEALPWSPEG